MLSHIRQGRRREAIIGKPVSLEAYGDVPDLMDNVLAWITRTEPVSYTHLDVYKRQRFMYIERYFHKYVGR